MEDSPLPPQQGEDDTRYPRRRLHGQVAFDGVQPVSGKPVYRPEQPQTASRVPDTRYPTNECGSCSRLRKRSVFKVAVSFFCLNSSPPRTSIFASETQ